MRPSIVFSPLNTGIMAMHPNNSLEDKCATCFSLSIAQMDLFLHDQTRVAAYNASLEKMTARTLFAQAAKTLTINFGKNTGFDISNLQCSLYSGTPFGCTLFSAQFIGLHPKMVQHFSDDEVATVIRHQIAQSYYHYQNGSMLRLGNNAGTLQEMACDMMADFAVGYPASAAVMQAAVSMGQDYLFDTPAENDFHRNAHYLTGSLYPGYLQRHHNSVSLFNQA